MRERRRLIFMQSIDVRREVFELVGTSSTSIDDLSTTLSEREPRFSCFRYTHQHEGQTQSPVIFIYTCPPGTKIKDRMVYALSRNGFVHAMGGSDIGLEISRKVSHQPFRLSPTHDLNNIFFTAGNVEPVRDHRDNDS